MKFAFVFDGLQFGGIERVGIEYVKLLKEGGHEVYIFNLCPQQNALESEVPKETKIYHLFFPRKIAPQRYSKLERKGMPGKIAFYICYLGLEIIQKLYRFTYLYKLPNPDIAVAFSGHYNVHLEIFQNHWKQEYLYHADHNGSRQIKTSAY